MPLANLFHRAPRPWTARRVVLNGAALRVLVVDDNHNAALALAAYLGVEGIEARAVFGGVEALDMGRAWTPHVILMDLTMPQCDGFAAARALRQNPGTSQLAIVAHTALDETEVRRHLLTGDEFDGYVQKGRPPAQLVTLIRILAP
jgi:two-component system, OmpR family, response regulator